MNYPYPSFKDHYYRDIYAATSSRIATAAIITSNTVNVFKNATIIKRLDEFKKIAQEIPSQKKTERIFEFMMERVVDDVRFIMCFENFIKSTLIAERYLIHVVSDKKLKGEQRERPICLDEVLTRQVFLLDNKKEFPITEKTIQFSDLLKLKYQETTKLPVNIYNHLRNINERRNANHFHFFVEMSPSELIKEAEELNDFVDKAVIPWVQRLDKEMKKGNEYLNSL